MADYKRKSDDITLIQMSNYVRPEVKEYLGHKWVLNGDRNSFAQYVIDRRNGSPTNQSIINVYCHLIYGKGISIEGQEDVYGDLVDIFPKREQQKCIEDFYQFGEYYMQVLRSKGGGVAKIMHVPYEKMGKDKADENGDINGYWYCEDWSNTTKNKPEFYPAFNVVNNKPKDALSIKNVCPYKAGKFYFADPSYLAGLQYAELEEEISNYSINHIRNGLSFGYVINMNNGGALTPEEKDRIEYRIREKLTGSSNAGKFILSFNDGKDAEVTVVPLEVNDAHSQWEFLSQEAMTKILTAHGVTSPLLFGLPSAGGFGSNADELDTASRLLQDYKINPLQRTFLDELKSIIEINGLETSLYFIPLRDTYKSTETKEEVVDETVDTEEIEEIEEAEVEMSEHQTLKDLINKGEVIDKDEWELVDDRKCVELNLNENQLNTIFQFASVPKTARKNSNQDTSLFKIRYRYAGNPIPEREFCQKVMLANKVYRAEDLDDNYTYNEKFAPKGKNSYNVFLYKGGVNCKHWWQRVIYLKKGNNQISVNEARKLILELDPEDRNDAKWGQNPKEVAQIASPSNNHWKLN